MNTWRIVVGDALERLRDLEDGSVQTCVTSPPYFGLRCYGNDRQLGLEATPDEYVARLVEVFREVRRVLRDDGTLWLNLGDSYAQAKGHGHWESRDGKGDEQGQKVTQRWRDTDASDFGVKPKDLLGIPWMVAFALRADGWYLRCDIIWAKKNCMPESVTDRPTKAHEYLFLLTKSKSYFYDADAIREEHSRERWDETIPERKLTDDLRPRPKGGWGDGGQRHGNGTPAGRNKRSVWTVATAPFPGAHFAVFPPKLIEPCVLAGSVEDACGVCGAPWERVVERAGQPPEPEHRNPAKRLEVGQAGNVGAGNMGFRASRLSGREMAAWKAENPDRTIGWEPSCDHQDKTGTSTVLDPFAGAGTTGLVATRLGRSFIGIELNPEYAEMARERIRQDQPLFNWQTEAV